MRNVYIEQLSLENYRNFQNFHISSDSNAVVLVGANGVGKTNILESISLMFPGRGIRSAQLEDITKLGTNRWSSKILLHSKLGLAELHTYFTLDASKRITEFNGKKITNSELCRFANILWITPQMEGIFLAASSERRRFLDRIVYSFHSNHAANINKYEHYVRERGKLLQHDTIDLSWLEIIEQKIAELSIEIATNRVSTLDHMQSSINQLSGQLTKVIIKVDGVVEAKLSSPNIIEFITTELKNRRMQDKISSRTGFGVHRSDLFVVHNDQKMAARYCSTGEQKAMLITILIAQVMSIMQLSETTPILLLDEVFVHLDEMRREYLIDFFNQTKMQIWVTVNELGGIENLTKNAQIVRLS